MTARPLWWKPPRAAISEQIRGNRKRPPSAGTGAFFMTAVRFSGDDGSSTVGPLPCRTLPEGGVSQAALAGTKRAPAIRRGSLFWTVCVAASGGSRAVGIGAVRLPDSRRTASGWPFTPWRGCRRPGCESARCRRSGQRGRSAPPFASALVRNGLADRAGAGRRYRIRRCGDADRTSRARRPPTPAGAAQPEPGSVRRRFGSCRRRRRWGSSWCR